MLGADAELGENLIKMYFYTLTQAKAPAAVLLLNEGVKLAAQNEQVIEHLRELEQVGCEVMVCGACLQHYGLTEELKAGRISNMYDIVERMECAQKVVTLP